MPTLVAMIYDMLNLVVHYAMIYIMVLIWKLPNNSTATTSVTGNTSTIVINRQMGAMDEHDYK
jgi:hypothetical protein